jgi:hypothetical protein
MLTVTLLVPSVSRIIPPNAPGPVIAMDDAVAGCVIGITLIGVLPLPRLSIPAGDGEGRREVIPAIKTRHRIPMETSRIDLTLILYTSKAGRLGFALTALLTTLKLMIWGKRGENKNEMAQGVIGRNNN